MNKVILVVLSAFEMVLNSIGNCSANKITLDVLMRNYEIDPEDLSRYKEEREGMPDLQAALIYILEDATNCNTVIGARSQEVLSFIKDIHDLLINIKEYLPPTTRKKIKENIFDKAPGLLDALSDLNEKSQILAQATHVTQPEQCLFKSLPVNLCAKIAGLTADNKSVTKEEADTQAYKAFGYQPTLFSPDESLEKAAECFPHEQSAAETGEAQTHKMGK